ncbi:uncharacterized protein BDR25DRAFT_369957 [Lindgomyces ingoldianus]|uniref:Uncharacterized protein n=1 Tax=Lindgomyces ingoldianus TaxID=673940 RepID=A0ACB6QTY1_9PLEO|nr:uncharacterized protein BDR25DRAFT_369957 [Lindgomyces ingoldianus]KAF2470033.1 hypothetical protein BDR25DRAFT_369957 [Lindgomyces ingoldianus]
MARSTRSNTSAREFPLTAASTRSRRSRPAEKAITISRSSSGPLAATSALSTRARSLQPTDTAPQSATQTSNAVVQPQPVTMAKQTTKAVPSKTKQPPAPQTAIITTAKRNAWGDSRAATESQMMSSHATLLVQSNIISVDTATKLAQPWHENGVLDFQWESQHLDPSRKHDVKMIDLDKAKKMHARKDVAEKKMLAEYCMGKIDEWGKPKGWKEGVVLEDEEDVDSAYAQVPAPTPVLTPTPAPTRGKNKATSGRVSKSTPNRHFSTIIEEASTPASPLPSTVTTPADYKEFGYFDLAAIGRERGLITRGNADALRARLVADDVAVRNGTAREMAPYRKPGAKQARNRMLKKEKVEEKGKSEPVDRKQSSEDGE